MNDLISRQAAIDAVENTDCELSSDVWDEITDAIMQVPSAQPEPPEDICGECDAWNKYKSERKGKWVKEIKHHKGQYQEFDYYEVKCSVCGGRPEKAWHLTPFCPNCGAFMQKEGDRNE